MTGDGRWALADEAEAVLRCETRRSQHVRCALHHLGVRPKAASGVRKALEESLALLERIAKMRTGASLAVKPSALGAGSDRGSAAKSIRSLAEAGLKAAVPVELDMEGQSLVPFTLETALDAAGSGLPVTVTLQSCLDRTPSDLERALDGRLRVRLVKGAYLGDIEGFADVQSRMRNLAGRLLEAGADFCAGTHDPELLSWLEERADRRRLEFGFLMGLADETKLRLASAGWRVVEYVPFGPESVAYIARRRRYLAEIERLGREPAP